MRNGGDINSYDQINLLIEKFEKDDTFAYQRYDILDELGNYVETSAIHLKDKVLASHFDIDTICCLVSDVTHGIISKCSGYDNLDCNDIRS